MSNYDVYLVVAMVLLLVSLLSGFNAVTNRTSIATALVLFVAGGFALYYATTLSTNGNLAVDIPGAFIRLYGKLTS